jgi:hypothetical protein
LEKKEKPSGGAGDFIEKYIQGKSEEADAKALYEGIKDMVAQNRFVEAELLRKKLMDVSPMSLSEIFETGELIEEKKYSAMDMEKVRPWRELFEGLSKTEAAGFYFLLQEKHIKANSVLFRQGDFSARLYFICSGRFVLSYRDQERLKENELAVLEKGDIVDAETFFSFSNHTTTLTALNSGEVFLLERDLLENIQEENPAIKSKIYDYCKKRKKIFIFGKEFGLVRRYSERYPLDIKVTIQELDGAGLKVKDSSKAALSDISTGGFCYVLRNYSQEKADALHNNPVRIFFPYSGDTGTKQLNKKAKVVSIRFLPFEECSVHAMFSEPLDEQVIKEILKSCKK